MLRSLGSSEDGRCEPSGHMPPKRTGDMRSSFMSWFMVVVLQLWVKRAITERERESERARERERERGWSLQ